MKAKTTTRTKDALTVLLTVLVAGALVALVAIAAGIGDKSKSPAKPAPAAKPAAAAPALGHNVTATLKEFTVNPSATQAAAGRVTFRVTNTGTTTHEFVVLRTKYPAGAIPLKNGRADESGNVGETGDLAVGKTKSVTLNLKPGHYALICNLPGHYQAGQHIDFVVK
jgi:uncharacterized cupredoxin-like copper-binding protein